MSKSSARALVITVASLTIITGCAVDSGERDGPTSVVAQESRFWPGCDGMDPTLKQCAPTVTEGDVTCTFAKADFDKCQADIHRFVGVTVTYSCSDGTTQTKKYVTGLTRGDGVADSDQKQYESGEASCENFNSTTKYDDISAINAIMPAIQNEATPLWQVTFVLPVHFTAPCWEARRRCVEMINNTTKDNGTAEGVTAAQGIKDATWVLTNKCSYDYNAGECRASVSNVDYECGLRCGASVSCRTACYTTVNDWCKRSSYLDC